MLSHSELNPQQQEAVNYGLSSVGVGETELSDETHHPLLIIAGAGTGTSGATITAGIQENSRKSFSKIQEQQINKLMFMDKIWVLDSQWLDNASYTKTKQLLQDNQNPIYNQIK